LEQAVFDPMKQMITFSKKTLWVACCITVKCTLKA
jgi:hypothetical protein